MLWVMETLGPGVHVDVTLTLCTYLNQVDPFIAAVFSTGKQVQPMEAPLYSLKDCCSGLAAVVSMPGRYTAVLVAQEEPTLYLAGGFNVKNDQGS